MNWLVAAAALPSLLVSAIVAAILRRQAPRWGLVDRPGQRKVHTVVTPFGGGLAIWAGVVLPLAVGQGLLMWWARADRTSPNGAQLDFSFAGSAAQRLAELIEPHLPGLVEQSGDLWFLLAAATVLMLLGLADDARSLDWRFRIAVEALVACVVVFGRGWQLTLFIDWPWLTGLVSVIWIVAIVNSFNMLDNMDGLSGGIAAIVSGMLAIVMLLTPESSAGGQLFMAGLLFVLCGSLIGFLIHNAPPARIFMGDAGAYFIGFMIAVSTILATFTSPGLPRHAILAPVCVLAVPLYDMFSVLCIRLRSGKSPFEADTNHFSHRLVDLGLTKTQAVLTIYLTTAACGLGALVLDQVNTAGAVAIVMSIVCLLSVIAILETSARRKIHP